MASNIETGHAINISNFKLMIDRCAVIPNYNPSNIDLTIGNMTMRWQTADTAHQTLLTAVQSSKNPINSREILYKPINKLTTKALNYFESTKASKQVKKDAKGLADKIRGFNTKIPKLGDGTPDPNHVSQSHQSFVQKQDTFKQLIDLFNSDPNFIPNEPELTMPSLVALNASMKSANDNIGTIIAPVLSARVTRDNALYQEETGMLDIAAACKDYIKGLLGSNANSRLITGIRFRRPKKKN